MKNTEKYTQVFMTVFQVKEEALGAEFTFSNVEMWDSLAHMTRL